MAGRKKIIIVDDDRETREMLKMALELEGYEEVASGRARPAARVRRVAGQGAGADPGGKRDRRRSPGGEARSAPRFRRGVAGERAAALCVSRRVQAGKGARAVRASGCGPRDRKSTRLNSSH